MTSFNEDFTAIVRKYEADRASCEAEPDRKILSVKMHAARENYLSTARALFMVQNLSLQKAHTRFADEVVLAISMDQDPPSKLRIVELEEEEYAAFKRHLHGAGGTRGS